MMFENRSISQLGCSVNYVNVWAWNWCFSHEFRASSFGASSSDSAVKNENVAKERLLKNYLTISQKLLACASTYEHLWVLNVSFSRQAVWKLRAEMCTGHSPVINWAWNKGVDIRNECVEIREKRAKAKQQWQNSNSKSKKEASKKANT